jgi:Asp-tRNA(Asn)/Glu-tRNA(Gln) amidotransferase A subunit family amidase
MASSPLKQLPRMPYCGNNDRRREVNLTSESTTVTLIGPDDTQPGPLTPEPHGHHAICRRTVLKSMALLGVGTNTFQRALAAQVAQSATVTPEMIKQSEWIAGLELTQDERASTARTIARSLRSFADLRKVDVGYDVPPALTFMPKPPRRAGEIRRNQARPAELSTPRRPNSAEELAFSPVSELSTLIRSRQVSSVELTKLYLERLRRFDPLLKCVVTYTDQLALKQAAKADEEIAAGHYRGPLHGIPWGAKDLIAYPGYPTTWGATPFKNRVIDEKAAVAARLEEAGAVLVAKLSLGALAMGDLWFGGRTNSPWDPRAGSSGSSAGSASAVAAGLVGFAIGSETLGSIVSPCRACGASGLRPTYGRISRQGCMTLSWSMDKLGPIARSIEDCALVFDAIHGADELDWAAVDYPFDWPPRIALENIKVGYIEERDRPADDRDELRVLRKIGLELVPITLPDDLPIQAITLMLGTEAAAVFDDITRKHITEGLNSWPESFRNGQFIPAVEYLRAARVRTKLMRAMAERMAKVDVYVGSGQDLPITNLTGHPCAVFPMGFRDRDGRSMPGSVTLTGRLYDETTLLAVAHAFQQATGDHYKRPPLETYLTEEQQRIDHEKSKSKDVSG